MSDTEIAVIKVHLEGIRGNIYELKEGYKKMIELMGRMVYIEDRFKANDESHRIIWEKLNKNTDIIRKSEPIIETVNVWKKNFNKLAIGAITIGTIEFVRLILLLYKGIK